MDAVRMDAVSWGVIPAQALRQLQPPVPRKISKGVNRRKFTAATAGMSVPGFVPGPALGYVEACPLRCLTLNHRI